ncbi:MAG: potassium transporter TrkG [Clostridia bacterium]
MAENAENAEKADSIDNLQIPQLDNQQDKRDKKPKEKFFRNHTFTGTQVLVIGYFVVILLGTFLLTLPISSRTGEWTGFVDAMFTATSATCVTGLIVFDTYSYWTIFGQLVILAMIQIGGIGFMTLITLIAMFVKRQIGLYERKILMQSAGTMRLAGVVVLIRRIILLTIVCEGVGTLLLWIAFAPDMGIGKGLCYAGFHSISAFCNAGFDLMGKFQPLSSLSRYSGNALVNLTIMGLIVMGGMGFVVYSDIYDKRFHYKKFRLHTKIALITTTILIFIPAIIFLLLERNHALANMGWGEAILASLFLSVSPRTAGFNTVDLNTLTNASNLLTILLMLVGGNPGSTAGGVKTITVIVVILGTYAAARNNEDITIGKRTIPSGQVKQASALFTTYLIVLITGTLLICIAQPEMSVFKILYEATSALGTVGVSLGITPELNAFSQLVLISMMFMGRVGAMSIATALLAKKQNPPLKRPQEEVLLG